LIAAIGGTVFGGIQQKNEAGRQARFAQEEAEDRARVEARGNIQLEKRQKLAFLKSGVQLAGSPLLVLAEDRFRGKENVQAILSSGQRRAKAFQQQGKQALISSLVSAAGSAAGGFSSGTFGGGQETLFGKPITGTGVQFG